MYNSQIKGVLDKNFIETDKPSQIISMAILSKKNAILYGEAGHAKSQMVEAAIEGIGMKEDCFIQSFGEGMTEDRIYGGVDLKAIEKEGYVKFAPERSFMNFGIAVFEELFDAPSAVLLSLKDTLTARELRNGAQRFQMKTRCIIALTNRSPSEISELGSAHHALIERFPLQLKVRWDDYKSSRYRSMYSKVLPSAPKVMKDMMADLIGQASSNGHFISPRSAIHAIEVVMEAQKGGAQGEEAYEVLRYIPGFEELVEGIAGKIERARIHSKVEKELDAIVTALNATSTMLTNTKDPIQCLRIHSALGKYENTVSNLTVTDDFVNRRNSILEDIRDMQMLSRDRAVEMADNV